ncbi:hypothetical protein ABB37_09103 [Leptomonas pyrrhocoris]|uniref:Uncharacterized protein n=1 Tax=Leptomonas pyrrhocoris TaxID=157538 RepID=A0A0M9FRE3_LEPPY|nr:hypothetical protein ABB37_09103 [Leptomonas pyrrhocoris]KPA74399.1 hypothetical protein ABB37_09103 [Leptomonas pyrrhocoris]|eukprot:XP_015652838.1 hypothetical protein ABB37_09103 [Leptomonas pyrrhocoris]
MPTSTFSALSSLRNRLRNGGRPRETDESSQMLYDDESLPEALPCPASYEYLSRRAAPTANTVITDEEELRPWLLVTRPVPREHAEKRGGCIVSAPSGIAKANSSTALQYFCLQYTDEADGRAAYLPRLDEMVLKLPESPTCHLESRNSSNSNACTEEGEDDHCVATSPHHSAPIRAAAYSTPKHLWRKKKGDVLGKQCAGAHDESSSA